MDEPKIIMYSDLTNDNKDYISSALEEVQYKIGGRKERKTIADDPPDEPMKIKLVTDEMIMAAKLKPVTDPIPFSNGMIPTEDGIYSNDIFGTTPDERRRQLAYIDLKEKLFHPYVYEIIKTLDKKIDKVAAGRGYWHVDDKGTLIEITSPDDKRYNEDATGLKWLIANFRKIKFKESDSLIRKEKLRMLKNLNDNELFISKFLVIPVFYRDVTEANGRPALPELSKTYNRLIGYTKGIGNNPFDFMNHQLLYNMQILLVEIRKFGADLIRGKHGALHRTVLGKTIDRGSRDVISVPVMDNMERPEDMQVDIFHSGFPLAKCLVLGYDFVIKYCLDFFENQFKDKKSFKYRTEKDGEYSFEMIPIKNQLLIFTKDYIDKRMKLYINTPTSRFDIIKIEAADGRKLPMSIEGVFNVADPDNPESGTLIKRPMTWTDLFYIAAYNTLYDKSVYTTRFPVTSYNSIFSSKCVPLSTVKTIPAYVNGKFYRNYPYIDLSVPKDKLNVLFIDTLTISNLFLDIIGGDYDGDTTSSKMVYSLEANQEAEEISHSKRNFITTDGDLMRNVKNEAYLTFFSMTNYA
jgi:hypothetical protein